MVRRVSSEKLIGRCTELATIDVLLAGLGESDACATSRCLLVGGEAGVGKTRLVAELAQRARAAGYGVAIGACVENGAQIVPLNAVVELLEGLAGNRLESSGTQGGVEPARLFQIVRRTLVAAAAMHPMVAIFEDLHWADRSTRDLIGALLPKILTQPVLVVGTYRTDELHPRHELLPLLAGVERAVRAERIELGPLSRIEIGALAGEILGKRPAATEVDTLHARGGGNPFLTEELLIGGIDSDTVPDSLRQVVLARRQSLGDAAATLTLDAAAVLTAPIDDAVLRETSGLPVADHEAALDALAERGLLFEDARGRGFRHELVRDVTARALPPGRRHWLHRHAADALAALQPQRLGEIARHRLASGDQPRALESLVAAGRSALAMGAAAEAVGHFVRALELWEQVPDARGRAGIGRGALLRLAATSSLHSRQLDRAVELGRLAAATLEEEEPAVAGQAWYEQSVYLWNATAPGVLEALERARLLTLTEPPCELSALIDHDRAYHATVHGDHDLAERLAARALATARRTGSAGVVAVVLSGIAERAAERGDASKVDELAAAIEAARDEPKIADVAKAVANLTYCLAMLGREEETPPIFESWIDRIVEHGLDGNVGLFLKNNLLDAYEVTGQWDSVQRLVDEMLTTYDHESLRVISAGLAANWGQVLIARGEYNLAASLFLRAHEELHSGYYKGSWGCLLAGLAELGGRGVIAPVGDDEIERILVHALPGEAIAAARAVATACRFRIDRRSGEALGTARRWVALVESAVAEHWMATPPALATWLDQARAEVATASGEGADPSWATIADQWRRLGRPYAEAYACYQWGLAELRDRAGTSRATRQAVSASLRRAHELATVLGAVPLATEVRNLARRARLDLRYPNTPAPPPPFGLTERELEVLRLVIDGRTDREIAAELFISRKTASLHVSRILHKVQATNRFEAAAIAGDAVARRVREDR